LAAQAGENLPKKLKSHQNEAGRGDGEQPLKGVKRQVGYAMQKEKDADGGKDDDGDSNESYLTAAVTMAERT